jgi:hypothetical protein
MYANTSSAMIMSEWQPVGWTIQASKSTLDDDQFVSERVKAEGITLVVKHPPVEPDENG